MASLQCGLFLDEFHGDGVNQTGPKKRGRIALKDASSQDTVVVAMARYQVGLEHNRLHQN